MYAIPAGYKRIQYIEGNNNAYIQTSIKLTDADEVRICANITGTGNVFGCYSGTNANDNFSMYVGNTYYARIDGKVNSSVGSTKNAICHWTLNKNGLYENGAMKAAITGAGTFTASANLRIGWLANASSAKIIGRIYEFEVVGTFWGVPVLDPDGVPGLWDLIGGAFYHSVSGTEFSAGPVVHIQGTTHDGWRRRLMMAIATVPAAYEAEVEYVDGNGTYVDIGIELYDHRIVTEFQLSNGYVNNTALFGIWSYRTQSNLEITLYNNKYYFGVGPYAEKNVAPAQPFDTGWHTYILSARGLLKVDQDVLYNTASTPVESNASSFIFARHYVNANGRDNISQFAKCPAGFRCRSFKIYDNTNDALVFDGIPVRIGTAGYIYDKISRQVFGGANGIDLVPGNDI